MSEWLNGEPGKKDDVVPRDRQNTVNLLTEKLRISPLAARILAARGLTTPDDAEAFLYPRLESLSDPFLLPDVEKGVQRVLEAIAKGERVCLYGDYDADGVSATALMVNFLTRAGANVLAHLPERKEGYGLNPESLRGLRAQGLGLLICLDCGSANSEEIHWALDQGIDTIVIDHHELDDPLPPALALINPKRRDSRFPTRELAACGVAFFFLLALRRAMHGRGLLNQHINLKRELDIVTVGTMGDMVPLTKDNRIITRFGMDIMRKQPRTWLRSFFAKKLISSQNLDEYALNFVIVPRINAAGRVSHPARALEFLTCEEEDKSRRALTVLHDANRERQKIEEKILSETIEMLTEEKLPKRSSIVLFKEDWHAGVIGIVAQKLTEMFGKPSIVITRSDGAWKGSGRGGEGIDLYSAVSSLAPLLMKFGGHKYACGLSLSTENLVPFRDAFDALIGNLPDGERERTVSIDTEAAFEELTTEAVEFMEMLSPFGIGNPRPALLLKPRTLLVTNGGRVKITDQSGRTWHAWAPRQRPLPKPGNVHIVATPSFREEMGERFIQLSIKEYIPAGP